MNKSTGLPTGTHYTYRNCFVVMVMPEKVWTSAVTVSSVDDFYRLCGSAFSDPAVSFYVSCHLVIK